MVLVCLILVGTLGLLVKSKTLPCLESVCPRTMVTYTQKDNGICDLPCMSPMCAYDNNTSGVSECLQLCGELCRSKVGDGHCDPGRFHTDCMKAECGWDMGDCGNCDADCRHYFRSYCTVRRWKLR